MEGSGSGDEAGGFVGGDAQQAQLGLGELVDGGLVDAFGVPLAYPQQPEQAAGHGAERDLGIGHGKTARGLPRFDVAQGARRQADGMSRASRPAPVRNPAMSGWVQPSRPEIRRPTAKSSAGSVMPPVARSIIRPQRSSTSSEAVWNSCSLLSKWL